jgi:HSP20 family molecular chaperone IbpA
LILPKLVDTERIEATYQDGVLTLVIPKVPKAQPKTVEIRTAGR